MMKQYRLGKLWFDVFLAELVSEMKSPSAIGEMKEDSKGSAAILDDEGGTTTREDPSNKLWKFPSGNSLFKMDSMDWAPPLLVDFLFRVVT